MIMFGLWYPPPFLVVYRLYQRGATQGSRGRSPPAVVAYDGFSQPAAHAEAARVLTKETPFPPAWVPEGSLAGNFRVGFRPVFGRPGTIPSKGSTARHPSLWDSTLRVSAEEPPCHQEVSVDAPETTLLWITKVFVGSGQDPGRVGRPRFYGERRCSVGSGQDLGRVGSSFQFGHIVRHPGVQRGQP